MPETKTKANVIGLKVNLPFLKLKAANKIASGTKIRFLSTIAHTR